MKYYNFLSKIRFLNKYSYKFLFVSFLGIHIPLIGIILFIVLGPENLLEPVALMLITLFLTLAATGVTLYILHKLIAPIRILESALHDYLAVQKLPSLPTHYQDEVGILLRDVQHTIIDLNYLLEEKKDLLAILTHELRNPILTIQQVSSLLRHETEPDMIDRFYQIIENASQQQLALIKTITNLWEHESANIQLYDLQPVQVSSSVDDVLNQQEVKLAQKQLIVQNKVTNAHVVYAEPNLINEVFHNIIYNAIKFSKPTGTISVWSEKTDDRIKIYIQDQGIGFQQDQSEGLFQRFTPFRRKGTNGEETIGLGLYLCRKLLQKQEGYITAHSAGEGKGAVFMIDLKAANAIPQPHTVTA
jgi:signal transduction histidine kinase